MVDLDQKKLRGIFESYPVIVAYLFGSQARGKAGPLSDIDIAVLLDGEVPREDCSEVMLKLMVELGKYFHKDDVEVVILNSAPVLLRHRILRDGQILYCSSELKRIQFETRAISEYFDFKPALDQYGFYLRKAILEGKFGGRSIHSGSQIGQDR